jgi:hypothetical protein
MSQRVVPAIDSMNMEPGAIEQGHAHPARFARAAFAPACTRTGMHDVPS